MSRTGLFSTVDGKVSKVLPLLAVLILALSGLLVAISAQEPDARANYNAEISILVVDNTEQSENWVDEPYKDGDASGGGGSSTNNGGKVSEGTLLSYYLTALENAGYTNVSYMQTFSQRTWSYDYPSYSDLKDYNVVIWFTGSDYPNVNEEDPYDDALAPYLDNGGRLFITGCEIAEELAKTTSDTDFFTDYMKFTYSKSLSNQDVTWAAGSPIQTSQNLSINGEAESANNNNRISILLPADAACEPILQIGTDTVGVATSHGKYRAVMFGFNFEAIYGSTDRTNTMTAVLEWLWGIPRIEHTPLGDTEDVENPYKITADIRDATLDTSSLALFYKTINSSKAESAFTKVDLNSTGENTYEAYIPAQENGTDVYYFLRALNQKDGNATHPLGVDANKTATWHTFHAGPDNKAPIITHTPPIDTVLTVARTITCYVTDNLGVDPNGVELMYRFGSAGNFTDANMTHKGAGKFTGTIPGASQGTSVQYKIQASDASAAANTVVSPVNGTYSYDILYSQILVVNDIASSYYDKDGDVTDLEDDLADVDYVLWETEDDGFPATTDLQHFSTVFWCRGTGEANDERVDMWEAIMDAGTNLVLSGTSVSETWSSSQTETFLEDYFHCESGTYYWGDEIYGTDGDIIGDSLDLSSYEGWFSGTGVDILDSSANQCFWAQGDVWFEDGGREGGDDNSASVGVWVDESGRKGLLMTFRLEHVLEYGDGEDLVPRILTWLDAPSISHTPLKDTEDTTGPYAVTATITDDDLDTSNIKMSYSTDNSTYTSVDMTVTTGNTYTANIPGVSDGTWVRYYISAKDLAGHEGRAPAASKAYTTYNTFYVGVDKIPPKIVHDRLLHTTSTSAYPVEAGITDSLGLDPSKVKVHYNLDNSATYSEVTMTIKEGDTYAAEIPGQSIGSTVYYYITAADQSLAANVGRNPAEGVYSFQVLESIPVLLLHEEDDIWYGFDDMEKEETQEEDEIDVYTELLTKMEVPYTYYSTSEKGGIPSSRELDDYDVVIYVTGLAWYAEDLQDYMDDGGNVFIASEVAHTGFEWLAPDFLDDYMHCELSQNTAEDSLITGVDGDFIGDGLTFDLLGDGIMGFTGPQMLEVDDNQATEIFEYPTGTAGVKVDDEDGFKMVYLTFSLSAVPLAHREEVLGRSLDWLLGMPGIDHVPLKDTEDTTGPYEVNATVSGESIVASNVKMHYSIDGGSFVELAMTESDGKYRASIPGQAHGTDISYYISVEDGDGNKATSPRGADQNNLGSLHNFEVGEDSTPPTLVHSPLSDNMRREYYEAEVQMGDNLGLDLEATKLYWRVVGDTNYNELTFTIDDDVKAAVPEHLVAYHTYLPGYELDPGDVVEYYIEAVDMSVAGNKARSPETGTHTFDIIERMVLVVDDDGLSDSEEPIVDALAELDIAYAVVEPTAAKPITEASLVSYSAVIWTTGNSFWQTITEDEADVLSYYLDNGGNLLMTGSGIGQEAEQGWNPWGDWTDGGGGGPRPLATRAEEDTVSSSSDAPAPADDPITEELVKDEPPKDEPPKDDDGKSDPGMPEPPPDGEDGDDGKDGSDGDFIDWYEKYLHAEYESSSTYSSVTGVDDHELTDGINFKLETDDLFGWLSSEVIDPISPAEEVLQYSKGSTAGLRYNGTHRVIYFAFDIADIQETNATEELIGNCVEWLMEGQSASGGNAPQLTKGRHKLEDYGKYNFTVEYSDADNDIPYPILLVIDDEEYEMKPVDYDDNNYMNGKRYFIELDLGPGDHDYYFMTEGAEDTDTRTVSVAGGGSGLTGNTGLMAGAIVAGIILLLIIIVVAIVVVLIILRKRAGGDKEEEEEEAPEEKKEEAEVAEGDKYKPKHEPEDKFKRPKGADKNSSFLAQEEAPLEADEVIAPTADSKYARKGKKKGKGKKKPQVEAAPAPAEVEAAPEVELLPPATETMDDPATLSERPGVVATETLPAEDIEEEEVMDGSEMETSPCPECGRMVGLDYLDCPHCGAELDEGLECPLCGAPVEEGADGCESCGAKFG